MHSPVPHMPTHPMHLLHVPPRTRAMHQVSDRADVYSLGLILWELCTRQRPWVGTRSAVIGYMVAMERQRPPLPPEDCPLCPPGLRSLIARCGRVCAGVCRRGGVWVCSQAHLLAAATVTPAAPFDEDGSRSLCFRPTVSAACPPCAVRPVCIGGESRRAAWGPKYGGQAAREV